MRTTSLFSLVHLVLFFTFAAATENSNVENLAAEQAANSSVEELADIFLKARNFQASVGEQIFAQAPQWQELLERETWQHIRIFQASTEANQTLFHLSTRSEGSRWNIYTALDYRSRPEFVLITCDDFLAEVSPFLHQTQWQLHYIEGRLEEILYAQSAWDSRKCPPAPPILSINSRNSSPIERFQAHDFTEINHWRLIDEIALRVRRLGNLGEEYEWNTLVEMLAALPHADECVLPSLPPQEE